MGKDILLVALMSQGEKQILAILQNYGYQDDYYRSNAYHSGGYDQSSRFSSQYYQSTSYDPYEYEYHPRGRNSSFRQQSDPSLVINMNEVSDSDSESDSQTP